MNLYTVLMCGRPCVSVGLCALSISHSNSFLAYPGSDTIGEIIVYDANNLVKILAKNQFCCSFWQFLLVAIHETNAPYKSFSLLYVCVSSSLQSTMTMIPAHDSPLAAITFSASGTKLASASERVKSHCLYRNTAKWTSPNWSRTCHVEQSQNAWNSIFNVPKLGLSIF